MARFPVITGRKNIAYYIKEAMKVLFHVRKLSDGGYDKNNKPHTDCFRMTVHNGYTNKDEEVWGVRINTLEQLINFQNDVDCKLLIQKSPLSCENNPMCLTIYDF